MLLLLELHGDLPDHFPNNERRLYLFGCPRKPCNRKPGSIRAYRATRKVTLDSAPTQPKEEHQPEKETEAKHEPAKPKQDLGASLFGATSLTSAVSANSNPFSSNPGSAAAAGAAGAGENPFATPKPATAPAPQPSTTTTSTNALAESFADKVRLSSPDPESSKPVAGTKQPPESSSETQTPWPAQSEFPTPYQNFYLDAEYETLSRPSTPTIPENVTVEPMDEGGSGSVTADLKDTFESELDKAFMKFSARLAHNPEQVLRYEYRGGPLLYSYTDQVGKRLHPEHTAGRVTTTTTAGGGGSMPRCEYCGGERVFELQLVPHAISVLEDGREGVGLGDGDAGMEWGTILLGVCGKDCAPETVGQVGWREEWAGVQWEEMK